MGGFILFCLIYTYNSQIKPTNKRVHDPVVREKYCWLVTEGVWRCIEREGEAPWHDRLLSDE